MMSNDTITKNRTVNNTSVNDPMKRRNTGTSTAPAWLNFLTKPVDVLRLASSVFLHGDHEEAGRQYKKFLRSDAIVEALDRERDETSEHACVSRPPASLSQDHQGKLGFYRRSATLRSSLRRVPR